jgi:hypothetical protein
VVRARNPCHSRALVAGAGVLFPLVGWDGLTKCGAFGLVLGINDGVRRTLEANYRPPRRAVGGGLPLNGDRKTRALALLTTKGESYGV